MERRIEVLGTAHELWIPPGSDDSAPSSSLSPMCPHSCSANLSATAPGIVAKHTVDQAIDWNNYAGLKARD